MSFTKGDLLLTGTPDGIGPVKAGDKLEISGSHKGAVLITAKFELVN